MNWRDRILDILNNNPGRKEKYLRSVLACIDRYGSRYPTPAQLTILRPMWAAHERRRLEAVLG